MKDLLAFLDPGDAMIELAIVCFLQTSILILLAAACVRGLLYRRPEARHALWFSVLVLVLVSPAIAAATRESRFALWAIELPARSNAEGVAVAGQRSSGESAQFNPPPPVAGSPSDSIAADDQPLDAAHTLKSHASGPAVISPAWRPKASHGGRPLIGGLTLLWLVGALIGLVRICLSWRWLAVVVRSACALDPLRHRLALVSVRQALGVAALPPVISSAAVRGPVAVGLWRPRIILPEGLAESLTTDALRDVLIHECAHVVRRDAWIGLFQRLLAAVFWPDPLIHYASAQLARAREEVCDNYVLRCGDPRNYSRTLLALTEQCLPTGAVRPQLGLFGTRWTLADRIAGLLDTRRVPMTRTTFRMRIAVWVLLAVIGFGATSVRISAAARAEGAQAKPAEPQAVATRAVWSVKGTVVDERGQPVAGAVVRAAAYEGAAESFTTPADGTFTLEFGGRTPFFRGVVALTDGGARIGLARFPYAVMLGANDPVKIVLKPSRRVQVHVFDAAGSPVAGAAVAVIGLCFRTGATTGPQGTATLQVAANAKVEWVIGLKSGAGFDYFENYRMRPPSDYPPLPADVSLTLDGAQTVRVRAVDATGQPVSGVEFRPTLLYKTGKIDSVATFRSDTVRVVSDQQGVATCGWLPNGVGFVEFHIPADGQYSCQRLPRHIRGGPLELTAHLLRETRLSGTVRFPDGRPAGGILIKAEGGPRSGAKICRAARTLADGSYVLDVPSETTYMVAVADETWAAPSLANVIVREGQAHGRLDFNLTTGTLIHGQIIEPPDNRPATGALVWLTEEGGPVTEDVRRSGFRSAQLLHRLAADAEGRYRFRVGPGRYFLRSSNAGGTEPLPIDVKNEPEVVRDLALKGPAHETYFSGVVVEETPTGDRPVASASVFRWKIGADESSYNSSQADDQGRFRMLRIPGEWVLYARTHELPLAGVTKLPAEPENVRVVVAKTSRISGRVVDSNGNALPHHRATTYEIYSGTDPARSGHQRFGLGTDDQGRFQVLAAPVGSRVEISVFYPIERGSIRPRVVTNILVRDANPIEVPDLIMPAEKPAK